MASCHSLANNVGTASRRIGGKEESASGRWKKAEELLLRASGRNEEPRARKCGTVCCSTVVVRPAEVVSSMFLQWD